MAKKNDLLGNNLFFLSAAFARNLTREADRAFAPLGLSSSHTLILLLIYHNSSIQPGSLAQKMHLKPSTITRLVQKLERRELVEKKSEGRATNIVCTSKGGDVAIRIEKQWNELLTEKRDQLGDRYVNVLSEMIAQTLDTVTDQ